MSAPEPTPAPEPKPRDPIEESRATFLEHMDELRKRLTRAVIAIVVCAGVAMAYAEELFGVLKRPLDHLSGHAKTTGFIVLSPMEMFVTYLKIALVTGLFAASPVVLWQAWKFVAPGLYPRERNLVWPFVVLGTLFFVGGGAFAYFLVFPYAFDYMLNMGPDYVKAQLSVEMYFGLTIKLLMAFGLVFELPVALSLLALAGIVDAQRLARFRKYFVIIAFVLAALLTPTPDPGTQLMMAVPLLAFYEIGVLFARIMQRRRADAQADVIEFDDPDDAQKPATP